MKDFYDISFLASEFVFEAGILQAALKTTFERRQTSLKSAEELLQPDLGEQAVFQRHWESFKKRTRLATKQDFIDVYHEIRSFLLPVVEAELERKRFKQVWNKVTGDWE